MTNEIIIEFSEPWMNDPFDFTEKYCTVNEEPIKLKDYQKNFIKQLYAYRSKKNRKVPRLIS